MDLRLTDKVALVAGSSRGIGRAIAHAFLAEGARVVVTGRQPDALEETRAFFEETFGTDRLLTYCVDLSQTSHVEAVLAHTYEHWGKIDCLVANIGSGTSKPGWQPGIDEWERVFRINFWSSLALVETALPSMVETGQGSIVFIGSIVGSESLGAPLPYSAAKAAVQSYSKNLARQVGPYGLRVNCVAPGNILFPGGSWERKMNERPDFFREYIRNEVPLQRFGKPEEIADLVVFVASERAAFITGAYMVADGGQTQGL
jgi:3-oxoacyl-[acyl-carrier protein] reductase